MLQKPGASKMSEIQSCCPLLRVGDILVGFIAVTQQLPGTLVRACLPALWGFWVHSKKLEMLTWLITQELESLESNTSPLLGLSTSGVCLKPFSGNSHLDLPKVRRPKILQLQDFGPVGWHLHFETPLECSPCKCHVTSFWRAFSARRHREARAPHKRCMRQKLLISAAWSWKNT